VKTHKETWGTTRLYFDIVGRLWIEQPTWKRKIAIDDIEGFTKKLKEVSEEAKLK